MNIASLLAVTHPAVRLSYCDFCVWIIWTLQACCVCVVLPLLEQYITTQM